MSNSFKFNLKGIKELRGKINELKAKGPQMIALVEAAAYDTNDDAISNIQSNSSIDLGAGGGLLSHQSVVVINEHTFEIVNSSKYAPFVEWGTGKQTRVSAEFDQYAKQFKGPYPGTWDQFEQNIKAWMKRHSIPEVKVVPGKDGQDQYIDIVYLIMTSILTKGLPARPFLYPAYIKNKVELIKKAKALLAKK